MKQVIKYVVKNVATNNLTTFAELESATKHTKFLRKLGIEAILFKQISSLYADRFIKMEV